jgi:hypothetical protein
MMFTDINASNYIHNSEFYNSEFESILSKVIASYNCMIYDNVNLNNDENKIRDVLYLNYLNNNTIREKIGLKDYYFDRETQEDRTNGRTDIRVLTCNSFIDTEAYYIIECKRLDKSNTNGTTGLNAEYISKGICRFVSGKYSSYNKTNGMIGFVVESINIDNNISSINSLLNTSFTQSNTTKALTNYEIDKDFKFSYCSTHNKNDDEIIIYHLMFDFSNNIK